ncbi:MAG: hypothetical protein HQK51_15585 [Oligoflexia bacterium]|nr:hypothetical protein [Oligoflexia bacterium]
MIYVYMIWVLFTGFAFASFIFKLKLKSEATNIEYNQLFLLRLSLTPLLGILVPSIIIYTLNFLNIKFSTMSLWFAWSVIGITSILIQYHSIKTSMKYALSFFYKQNLFIKIFLLLIVFGLLGIYARVCMNEIWSGDGLGHWGMKIQFWLHHGHISYTPTEINLWKHWMTYPLYHSIGMMLHVLAIPFWPTSYAAHLNDAFYFFGVFFTSLLFINITTALRGISIVFWAAIISFGQRELLGTLISSYAEIDLAYFIFLILTLIFFLSKSSKNPSSSSSSSSNPNPNPNYYQIIFVISICIGVATITKTDGLLKASLLFITILIHSVIFNYFKIFFYNFKSKLFLLPNLIIPAIFLIIIDKINKPQIQVRVEHQFYDHIIWNLNTIIERLPKGFLAFYYNMSITCESVHKCSFTLAIAISVLALFYLLYLLFYLPHIRNKKVFHQMTFLLIALLLNYTLNLAPIIAVNNIVDKGFDVPILYAEGGLSRYNLHAALILNSLVVLFIINFIQNFLKLFLSKNKSTLGLI